MEPEARPDGPPCMGPAAGVVGGRPEGARERALIVCSGMAGGSLRGGPPDLPLMRTIGGRRPAGAERQRLFR